jgi:hypothetical protein
MKLRRVRNALHAWGSCGNGSLRTNSKYKSDSRKPFFGRLRMQAMSNNYFLYAIVIVGTLAIASKLAGAL